MNPAFPKRKSPGVRIPLKGETALGTLAPFMALMLASCGGGGGGGGGPSVTQPIVTQPPVTQPPPATPTINSMQGAVRSIAEDFTTAEASGSFAIRATGTSQSPTAEGSLSIVKVFLTRTRIKVGIVEQTEVMAVLVN